MFSENEDGGFELGWGVDRVVRKEKRLDMESGWEGHEPCRSGGNSKNIHHPVRISRLGDSIYPESLADPASLPVAGSRPPHGWHPHHDFFSREHDHNKGQSVLGNRTLQGKTVWNSTEIDFGTGNISKKRSASEGGGGPDSDPNGVLESSSDMFDAGLSCPENGFGEKMTPHFQRTKKDWERWYADITDGSVPRKLGWQKLQEMNGDSVEIDEVTNEQRPSLNARKHISEISRDLEEELVQQKRDLMARRRAMSLVAQREVEKMGGSWRNISNPEDGQRFNPDKLLPTDPLSPRHRYSTANNPRGPQVRSISAPGYTGVKRKHLRDLKLNPDQQPRFGLLSCQFSNPWLRYCEDAWVQGVDARSQEDIENNKLGVTTGASHCNEQGNLGNNGIVNEQKWENMKGKTRRPINAAEEQVWFFARPDLARVPKNGRIDGDRRTDILVPKPLTTEEELFLTREGIRNPQPKGILDNPFEWPAKSPLFQRHMYWRAGSANPENRLAGYRQKALNYHGSKGFYNPFDTEGDEWGNKKGERLIRMPTGCTQKPEWFTETGEVFGDASTNGDDGNNSSGSSAVGDSNLIDQMNSNYSNLNMNQNLETQSQLTESENYTHQSDTQIPSAVLNTTNRRIGVLLPPSQTPNLRDITVIDEKENSRFNRQMKDIALRNSEREQERRHRNQYHQYPNDDIEEEIGEIGGQAGDSQKRLERMNRNREELEMGGLVSTVDYLDNISQSTATRTADHFGHFQKPTYYQTDNMSYGNTVKGSEEDQMNILNEVQTVNQGSSELSLDIKYDNVDSSNRPYQSMFPGAVVNHGGEAPDGRQIFQYCNDSHTGNSSASSESNRRSRRSSSRSGSRRSKGYKSSKRRYHSELSRLEKVTEESSDLFDSGFNGNGPRRPKSVTSSSNYSLSTTKRRSRSESRSGLRKEVNFNSHVSSSATVTDCHSSDMSTYFPQHIPFEGDINNNNGHTMLYYSDPPATATVTDNSHKKKHHRSISRSVSPEKKKSSSSTASSRKSKKSGISSNNKTNTQVTAAAVPTTHLFFNPDSRLNRSAGRAAHNGPQQQSQCTNTSNSNRAHLATHWHWTSSGNCADSAAPVGPAAAVSTVVANNDNVDQNLIGPVTVNSSSEALKNFRDNQAIYMRLKQRER